MIVEALDGGSLTRLRYLAEAVSVMQYLQTNFTVNDNGQEYTYAQLCQPSSCNTNEVVQAFLVGYGKYYCRSAFFIYLSFRGNRFAEYAEREG